MEDSLNARLDEVEQELVRLLSLRAHDLQLFSSRQDQLLQSHYHSISSTIKTAQIKMTNLNQIKGNRSEINERWNERRNLKRFWVYCEEIQRENLTRNTLEVNNETVHDNPTITSTSTNTNTDPHTNTNTNIYQTPVQNDSKVNISTASLTSLCDLSLD